MNVLQNLIALYNHLSSDSTYRNVCAGILEHLKESAEGTIYDIAEITNSSRTTVWRMVQKLGYHSFTDFHYELKQAVNKYNYFNRIIPESVCSSSRKIKDAMTAQLEEAEKLFKQNIDLEFLETVAERLHKSDKVSFYLSFQSSSVFSLQQNLSVSGIRTAYLTLMPDMIEDSASLTEKSTVFVSTIDHAETMDLTSIFTTASQNGACILGMQNSNTKYKKFIEKNLISAEPAGVLSSVIVFEFYFYLLSEVYRMKFIN